MFIIQWWKNNGTGLQIFAKLYIVSIWTVK
uniref:Uncharacterized protein n=1 Tax=Arundo donax TaxID=35708 RepID=A0A0A9D3R1_ARUDO